MRYRRSLSLRVLAVAVSLVAASCSSSSDAESSTTSDAVTDSASTTAATTSTVVPSTTTTSSTLPVTADPEALLERVNEAMAAQTSFLLRGELVLTEADGSAVTLSTGTQFGGQASPGNQWQIIEAHFDNSEFAGTLQVDVRRVDGAEFIHGVVTGTWVLDDEEDDYDPLDALLNDRLILTDLTATDTPGGYQITGRGPDDQLVELHITKGNVLVESMEMRETIPRGDLEGLVPAEGDDLVSRVTLFVSEYGSEVATVLPPPSGLATDTYASEDHPFQLQVPADWTRATAQDLIEAGLIEVDAAWSSQDGLTVLVIVEDLIAVGFGETTLEDYAGFIEEFVLADAVITDREIGTTLQAEPAVVIRGSIDEAGFVPFVRLMYLHDSTIAGNISVFGPRLRFEEAEELIGFILNTLVVDDPK